MSKKGVKNARFQTPFSAKNTDAEGEIGILESILHNRNEIPEHNFQGAMLDEAIEWQ